MAAMSKIATGNGHGENSPYFEGWKAYETNPFHPVDRPDGVIQMGLAENQLCLDIVKKWLVKHPEASFCTAQGVSKFKETALFQDYHGMPEFRGAVAKFMGKVRGDRVKFDPERIVMSGGATGAHEIVAFPWPILVKRFSFPLLISQVNCESCNNFNITGDALEAAYVKAQEANLRVKGLLLTNPSNPLGTILDRDTLKNVVKFINQKNIHLIGDEIYAATVFMEPEFGIVYSYNDAVVSCARKMSSFGLVSSQTQYLIASLLSDDDFVDNFISESRELLFKRHKYFTWSLSQVGIGSLKSMRGCLYGWICANYSKTRHSKRKWSCGGFINEVKLNVSPGSSFHCDEPGWFRVCFANMDDSTMQVALSRIRSFVVKNNEAMVPPRKLCRRSSLKLSLSRRMDDLMSRASCPPTLRYLNRHWFEPGLERKKNPRKS
ncbi:1-aminocyclopropane-1-carboxylate synthase [Hibiscus syriacus]|uniref:1-aminocyclopropane-1-carboxylate synthase n=1 Tax=Hibiscus syriacus TaxID=106335 RepID=A0A6A2YDM0_HIBSY|nr:1-aminocyclopropane-1-carboxylate synthase [Hibiscus syriacus]